MAAVSPEPQGTLSVSPLWSYKVHQKMEAAANGSDVDIWWMKGLRTKKLSCVFLDILYQHRVALQNGNDNGAHVHVLKET